MDPVVFGVLAGLVFGILDVLVMIPLELPDKKAALAGAFIGRFAIGFLIPVIDLPLAGWLLGVLVGLLLSLPDAIITKTYAPIVGIGAVGGGIIGWLVGIVVG